MLNEKWVELLVKVDFTRRYYSTTMMRRYANMSGPTMCRVCKVLIKHKVLKYEKRGCYSLTEKGILIRSKLLELQKIMGDTMEMKPREEQEKEDFEEYIMEED